jgi:hypothetical protein
MAQREEVERRPSGSRVRGMSLYASSADYERRVSEDCLQPVAPAIVEESQLDQDGRPKSPV